MCIQPQVSQRVHEDAMDPSRGRRPRNKRTAIYCVLLATLCLAVTGQIAVPPQSLAEPDARRHIAPLSAEDAHAAPRARNTESLSRLLENATIGKYTVSAEQKNAGRPEPLVLTGQVVNTPQIPRRGGAGLSFHSQPRDLQDFELEDIVLLATIDGSIHACDRRTGRERWSLDFPDNPMIHTTNYPRNRSSEDDTESADDYIFIVEPSREGKGSIYMQNMNPTNGGLQKLSTTIQTLANTRPYFIPNTPFSTAASQESSLYTVDAATGSIIQRLDVKKPFFNPDRVRSCPRVDPFSGELEECEPIGTFIIGRMEYTILIMDTATSIPLCEIKYAEWTINSRDTELQFQHDTAPLEGRQIYSFSNGQIMGVERADETGVPKYRAAFDSPVAQVFDVARPVDTKGTSAPLVILSQPLVLPQDAKSVDLYQGMPRDHSKVFVNKTSRGSYYLMSEEQFPFSTNTGSWSRLFQGIDTERMTIDPDADEDVMTGNHRLDQSPRQLRTLDAPPSYEKDLAYGQDHRVAMLPSSGASPLYDTSLSYSSIGAYGLPFLVLLWFVFSFRRGNTIALDIATRIEQYTGIHIYLGTKTPVRQRETELVEKISSEKPDGSCDNQNDVLDVPFASAPGKHTRQNSAKSSSEGDSGEWEKVSALPTTDDENVAPDVLDDDYDQAHDRDGEPQEAQPEKKNRPLPRNRGGKKHKKKKVKGLEDPLSSAAQASEKDSIAKLVQPVSLDGHPATPDPTFVPELQLESGLTQVGVITVDQRLGSRLGDGSNGTIVFRGTCFSRAVAVKRLIRSPKNFAAAEIKHLPKLDSHQNVVRFHSVQESQNFTWIALELYTTSLDKIVERPELHPDLVHAAGLDVNDVLYQVARGVEHLHGHRVVHRDIKPQNVLVRLLEPPGQHPVAGRPKLEVVLSDFGLCKMLDDGPGSAFALTGNHTAAGTTGWKAPELLANGPSIVVDAGSSSDPTSTSSEVSGVRRPGKSIDIFSLGCLFFYVMTQGGHPFDQGGSYARDLNIKEGKSDTRDLLSFHSYTYEADDLILQMISHEPENRPSAIQILQHPYFWPTDRKLQLLCDVSDCFERQKNAQSEKNAQGEKNVRVSSPELDALEAKCTLVWTGDFLKRLPPRIITEAGKQRKYTGTRMIDLLRLIRNKKNHFHDLPDEVKFGDMAGTLDGYYHFFSSKFPSLLVNIHCLLIERGLRYNPDFRELSKYFD